MRSHTLDGRDHDLRPAGKNDIGYTEAIRIPYCAFIAIPCFSNDVYTISNWLIYLFRKGLEERT